MDYAALLTESWKKVWTHKALLALGLLGGLPQLVGLIIDFAAPDLWADLLSEASSTAEVARSLVLLATLLVSGLIGAVLAQAGVLTGVRETLQSPGPLRFGPTLARSTQFFLTVLGAWMAVGAAFLFILALTMGCQFASAMVTAGLASICSLPFLLVGFLLLSIGMDLATGLTSAAVVLDGLRLRPAFRRTRDLLRGNAKPVFVVGLLLSLLLRLALFLLTGLAIAMLLLAALLAAPGGAGTGETAAIAQALRLAFFPVQLIGVGIAQAFVNCGWGLAYLRLHQPSASMNGA